MDVLKRFEITIRNVIIITSKWHFENKETKKIEIGVQEVKSNENEQIYIILSFPYTFTFLSRSE